MAAPQTRWQCAKRHSRGFKAWKREAVLAVVTLPFAYGALEALGSEAGATDQLISAGAVAIAVLIAFPLLELGWNYAWAETRLLRDEVGSLREAVEQSLDEKPSKPSPRVKTRTVNVRVTVMNHARRGREVLDGAQLTSYPVAVTEAQIWANTVVGVLSKYVGSEAAEGFLQASNETGLSALPDQLEFLENLIEQGDLPTAKRIKADD